MTKAKTPKIFSDYELEFNDPGLPDIIWPSEKKAMVAMLNDLSKQIHEIQTTLKDHQESHMTHIEWLKKLKEENERTISTLESLANKNKDQDVENKELKEKMELVMENALTDVEEMVGDTLTLYATLKQLYNERNLETN